MMQVNDSMMLWSGSWVLFMMSFQAVSTAVYFYDTRGSREVQYIDPVCQAGLKNFTQRNHSPREGQNQKSNIDG